MSNIINGYGAARLDMIDALGYYTTFTFPICAGGSANETTELKQEIVELEYRDRLVPHIYGLRKKFTLDFSTIINGSYLLASIMPFIEGYLRGNRLILYPKAVNLNYNFEVIFSNTQVLLQISQDRSLAAGHTGLVLEFIEVRSSMGMQWYPADDLFFGFINPTFLGD